MPRIWSLALGLLSGTSETYVFRDVFKNVRFQRHVQVDCSCDPAQFSLPDTQDPIFVESFLISYLKPVNIERQGLV